MSEMNYICHNGKIISENDLHLACSNRAFQYGDGLFESMHASGNKVQFFYEHFDRLIRSMKLLKMEIPVRFSVDTYGIQKDISKILIKNKLFKGARVRISVFRQGGGFFAPDSNETEYLIECSSIPSDRYELNQKGLLIDIYEEMAKPINTLSRINTSSSMFNVLAGIYKAENKLDECIVMNTKGNIVEGISSNIFVVKENLILTPSLREGCLPGIMRQKAIELARKLAYSVQDEGIVQIQDIMAADEIFYTNAVNGIQWVVGFKQRRYFNKVSKALILELNKLCFPELFQHEDLVNHNAKSA
jgi:branched-subunit amino acid aminotransferase/4-amino-4-deoxychorismate lyase